MLWERRAESLTSDESASYPIALLMMAIYVEHQRQSASPRKTHKCALHSQLILSYLRRVAHTNT